MNHPIKGRPQGGVISPQTAGLQQLQGRLLLGLEAQQPGPFGGQEPSGLVEGVAQGRIRVRRRRMVSSRHLL